MENITPIQNVALATEEFNTNILKVRWLLYYTERPISFMTRELMGLVLVDAKGDEIAHAFIDTRQENSQVDWHNLPSTLPIGTYYAYYFNLGFTNLSTTPASNFILEYVKANVNGREAAFEEGNKIRFEVPSGAQRVEIEINSRAKSTGSGE